MDLDTLHNLEKKSLELELPGSTRADIWDRSLQYLNGFIDSLPDTKAYVKKDCPRLYALEMGNEGKSFSELLGIIADEVDQAGINAASGGHLGYIPGGGLWLSGVGDMLAAVANKYAGIMFSGTGAVIMENQLLKWMCSLVGYPSTAHGNITSGGSLANMAAITTARDDRNISPENTSSSVIYYTREAHHCIPKAVHITGLGSAVQRMVAMNDRYQMDVEDLQRQIIQDIGEGLTPFLVIATAGTTNTGAIDPLDDIADVCRDQHIWFHVDAAYGGFFLLVDSVKDKFKGIERADSMVLDPHKGLFLPFGTGVVLVKDGKKLIRSHSFGGAYMVDASGFEDINPADCGPELTRHFRGMRMWLPLHYHGLDVFKACLEEKIYLCRYFHTQIGAMGFETGHDPELSISLFRYPAADKNKFNRKLVEKLHADGRIFFSSTLLGEEVWIRCAVLSFRTHLREIRLALEMIRENLVKIKDE